MSRTRKISRKPTLWELAVMVLFALLFLSCWPAFGEQKAVKRDQQPAQTISIGEKGDNVGELYCLVVGVSKYANPGIPQLNLAVKDAKDFAAFVKTQEKYLKKVHLKELLDKDATRFNILRYLNYDLRNAGKDDTVILYFSGHGSIDTKFAADYYFLSYDADPDFPVVTAVQLSRDMLFSRLAARKVLVVLDACHSGTPAMHKNIQTRSTGESLKGFLEQFKESHGQLMITSSSPNEYSMEFPDLPNGVFTYFLLEGLKGKADSDKNGIVSAKEAYDYAYEMTKKRTDGGQHPAWSGDLSGTFPLAFLKPQGGTIELVTDPPGVQVAIKKDKQFKAIGNTDLSGKMKITDLPIGKSLIFKFSKEGWEELIPDPIILSPDDRELKHHVVKLTSRRAHLTVRTNTPGVSVRLDNADRGETDADNFVFLEDIQVSVPHELVLKKEGFHDKKVSLVIPPTYENRVFHWQGKLDPIPVKKQEPKLVDVAISTAPAEVEVYVGDSNTPAGKTDTSGHLKLQVKGPGAVVFQFRKSGHLSQKKEVSLPAEGSLVVSKVNLSPVEPTLKLFVDQAGAKVFIKRTQEKAIKREDTETGYEYVGETDVSGHITVKNLPIAVPVRVKIKKTGWKERILGPFVFSEDNALISPAQIVLESAVAKEEPAEKVRTGAEERSAAKLTATDLLINTDPGEVCVSISGEYKGDSDNKGELRIKGVPVEKSLKVVFKKYGYLAVEKSIKLAAVASSRMDMVVLNRLLTRVECSVNEPFADIFVKHAGNFEPAGKADSIGKMVLEDLPIEKNIFLKIKKDGWREKSVGPVKLTEQKPHAKLPDVKLEPALATVKIPTDPAGVKVTIDGGPKKDTSGSVITLTDIQVLTDHEIELSKEGYQPKQLSLHLEARYDRGTFRMDPVKLERAYAKLELRTDRPGVTVKLDGNVADRTDKDGKVLVEKVPVGIALTIEFEKEGFGKKSIKVTVPPDYEGGTYSRKDVVYLDAERKPTENIARPSPDRSRPESSYQEPSQRRPAAEPSFSVPRESGSNHDTMPTGPARFPSDFTN